MSSTVIVCVAMVLFSHSSVATHVRMIWKLLGQVKPTVSTEYTIVTSPQLSMAVASSYVTSSLHSTV